MTKMYLYGIWLLLFSSAFVRVEPAPYDIFLVVLFGAGLATPLLQFRQYLIAPMIVLALFVLSNIVSMVFATEYSKGIEYFAITFYLILTWIFFVGLFGRFGNRGIEIAWSGYVAAAVVTAAIALLINIGFFVDAHWFLWGEGRAVGLFKDPNVFGAFLVPPAVYAIQRSDHGKRVHRLLWLLMFLVLSFGVLLSMSRGAWANYVVALVTFFLISFALGRKADVRPVLKVVLVVAAVLIYAVSQSELGALLIERVSFQPYDEERFLTQALALQTALSKPLGIGPGQSEILFQYATHSLYLRLLSEYGWVGLFAFVSFVLMTAYRAFRGAATISFQQRGEFALIVSVLCGVLFNSLFIDSLHWRHLWFLLALPWFALGYVPQRVIMEGCESTLPYHPR